MKLIHCVIQMDADGYTTKTHMIDGEEWSDDWNKAIETCGKLNETYNSSCIGGFEVVSVTVD